MTSYLNLLGDLLVSWKLAEYFGLRSYNNTIFYNVQPVITYNTTNNQIGNPWNNLKIYGRD